MHRENMSNKELAMQLLNNVPPYKMGYVVAYLQGITADEDAADLDEVAAIKAAHEQMVRGDVVGHSAIDWN